MKSLPSLSVIAILFSSCTPSPANQKPGNQVSATPVTAHPNWQNEDLEQDSVFGISTDKAYSELLNGKKGRPVVVAVFDTGIDTTQEDLQPVLWTSPADGTHGRNYISTETGKEDFLLALPREHDPGARAKTVADLQMHRARLQDFINRLRQSKETLQQVVKTIGQDHPIAEDFREFHPRNDQEARIVSLVLDRLPLYPDYGGLKYSEVDHVLDMAAYHLSHGLKEGPSIDINKDSVIDADITNDAFGLIDDDGGRSGHGTHTSGIIAAVRKNGKGIDGIADQARIMMLKLFGSVRESRDLDVADAIRFAADHGAQIISMSFGKTFSAHKKAVDSAVQYAVAKGLLIVHSAGNDGMDLDVDSNTFFPSAKYLDGHSAAAWITVGASGFQDDSTLFASFSNYGHKSVDVFAPGVEITSTVPHSQSESRDGTSQSAPIVAGLAALIWSYYPGLTALQVKGIIMSSIVKRTVLADKCVSGGVVNAYNALKLAGSVTNEGPKMDDR